MALQWSQHQDIVRLRNLVDGKHLGRFSPNFEVISHYPFIVYDRNSFLFNIQKQIYCTQIFTENLFNRKIKYITVTNRNTLIFCLFLLFPWFVSVGLSVSFLFYTNEQQKMNRKPISCFCSVSTIQFSVATETKITERNKQ